jgi:hypothetical protein
MDLIKKVLSDNDSSPVGSTGGQVTSGIREAAILLLPLVSAQTSRVDELSKRLDMILSEVSELRRLYQASVQHGSNQDTDAVVSEISRRFRDESEALYRRIYSLEGQLSDLVSKQLDLQNIVSNIPQISRTALRASDITDELRRQSTLFAHQTQSGHENEYAAQQFSYPVLTHPKDTVDMSFVRKLTLSPDPMVSPDSILIESVNAAHSYEYLVVIISISERDDQKFAREYVFHVVERTAALQDSTGKRIAIVVEDGTGTLRTAIRKDHPHAVLVHDALGWQICGVNKALKYAYEHLISATAGLQTVTSNDLADVIPHPSLRSARVTELAKKASLLLELPSESKLRRYAVLERVLANIDQ